jgi:cytochrome c556
MKITRSILPVVFILLFIVSFSLSVGAQDGRGKSEAMDIIEERSELMRSIRDAFQPISSMLKAGAFEIIVVKSREIADLAKGIVPAFSKKALSSKSRAKVEIWKESNRFAEEAREFTAAIAELEQAAKTSDTAKTRAGVARVLKACKACHRSFRKPKAKAEDEYQG